ncbi:addiction module protein [Cerasicoccus arenae]|uniref:Acyl-protein synthetase n=1 Tax=Cerasicoccus arenae TaxID=424488 RepID=A0A8J3GFL4_9BACT|nr:addiction module protein [Cerasicoccus arenae]MBK1860030.1 addiction module protein [Cerasicoccus arenae]GHC12542.1 hypothetical protein GCM10007047_32370 [Cerasicoccus arenae]
MLTENEVRGMPLNEKLRLMEMIWDNIHHAAESFESPDWHRSELEATEERRKAGLEIPMDWNEAKQKLLKR